MKSKSIFFLSFIMTTIVLSCSSSDDNNTNNNGEPLVGNYFPSSPGDIWTYNVEGTNSNDSNLNFSETDFISVATSVDNDFTLIANNNNSPATGTMNAILVNGTLTRDDSTLKFSGNLDLPDEFSDFSGTTISLQDVFLYDLNAANNAVLSELSGSFNQELELQGSLLPLTITYTLTTKKISNLNSLTVDGEVFTNITKTSLYISMKVVTSIDLLGLGNPVDYDLLPTQDVLTIENYFAESVGLIKSEAYITYELDSGLLSILEDLSIDIGIPATLTIENSQELENYLIAE